MGSQQLFILALSVIIVGIMIAVGFAMFNAHIYSTNKRALASEMTTYAPFVFKFWKTNKILGGAAGNTANLTIPKVAAYIGFNEDHYSTHSDNGEFRVTAVTDSSVVLQGLGHERRNSKHPLVITTIQLDPENVSTEITDAATWQ